MLERFVPHLVDPDTLDQLVLANVRKSDDGHVEEGVLRGQRGTDWRVVGGIPRFVSSDSAARDDRDESDATEATAATFGRKWKEARSLEYGSRDGERASMLDVMQHMLRAGSEQEVMDRLGQAQAVLNVGCGVAWPEDIFNPPTQTLRFAIDYSDAVDTALMRTRARPNVFVAQADLFHLPFRPATFDIMYSGGVVHHTPDPGGAVKNLCRYLKPGGLLGMYIYTVKPFLRELADREIRKVTTAMSYEDCNRFAEQMSLLGRALQQYQSPLKIEQDIPLLGILKGTYNLQKFLYDHFLKCFFNADHGMELSTLTNLDWYHPVHASHHPKEEVFGWLEEAGMHDMTSTNPPGWQHSSNFITARRK